MNDTKAPALNYHVCETYVNKTENVRFGDSGLYESFTNDLARLFKKLQKEFGRCSSKMFIDSKTGTKHVGWVFEKRMQYEDSKQTYMREVWVEVKELYHA